MRDPIKVENRRSVLNDKTILLLSLGSLVVGSSGYFLLQRDFWMFYFFAHLGALGVMGLFGSAAGILARKKQRSYWIAFSFGGLLPIISGIVAVLIILWLVSGDLYCGGSVSLIVAVLALVSYLLVKKKTPSQTGHT